MNTVNHLKEAAIAIVDDLMDQVGDIKASVVCTEDGFEVAARADSAVEAARLSAMASSMVALGVIAGEDHQLGLCRNVVIRFDAGHIVMLQAQREDVLLVVSVVGNSDAQLNRTLHLATQAALALEAA